MNEMLRIPHMLARIFRDKVRFLLLLTLLNTTWIVCFVMHASEHEWLWLAGLSLIYLPLLIHQGMLYYYLNMILKLPGKFNSMPGETRIAGENAYYQSADSIHDFHTRSWGMGQGLEALVACRKMYDQPNDISAQLHPVIRAVLLVNPLFIVLTLVFMFITTLITLFSLIAYL
jgi:hypothetical protein